MNLTAGTIGSISLDASGNRLAGTLSLSAASGNLKDVNISNTLATKLGGLTVGNNFTITSGGALTQTGPLVVGQLATINAAGQDVTLMDAGNDFNQLAVSAANNVQIADKNDIALTGVTTTGKVGITAAGIATINDVITSTSGAVNVTGKSVTQQTAGTINGNTGVTLTAINVSNGTASLNADQGAITDNNGAAVNLVAGTAAIRSAHGIGSADSIETQTGNIDAINTTDGTVLLANTGVVTLTALQNKGAINLSNDTDILFTKNSVNAGYGVGDIFISTTKGSFLGVGTNPGFSNPDITGRTAIFLGTAGTFGTTARPLVLNVSNSVSITTRASLNPQFAAPRPTVDDQSLLQFSSFDTLSAISGEQLVTVESPSDIDPAIFTDVTNYDHEQIAIRLPPDQLYRDEP